MQQLRVLTWNTKKGFTPYLHDSTTHVPKKWYVTSFRTVCFNMQARVLLSQQESCYEILFNRQIPREQHSPGLCRTLLEKSCTGSEALGAMSFLLLRPQWLTQVLTHYQCVFMEESLISSMDYSSFTQGPCSDLSDRLIFILMSFIFLQALIRNLLKDCFASDLYFPG